MLEIQDLPALNASLNAVCTVCLLVGYWAIRTGPKRVGLHKAAMLAAFFVSAAFLTSYLIYHVQKPEPTRFTHPGWPKTLYLLILLPHIALAMVEVPLILKTLYHALRGQFDRHRRVARWTFPIWLYVSVTGVLVYLMLYQWFPPQ